MLLVGLDRNHGMLAVAAGCAPDVQWIEAKAEAMPLATASFDVVLCQFGLMFFDDPAQALAEMQRVLAPGGRIAISVWDDVANSPGYAGMIDLIEGMFGPDAADALRAPFVLGPDLRSRQLWDAFHLGVQSSNLGAGGYEGGAKIAARRIGT